MKQVFCLITLAKTKDIRSYRCIILAKCLDAFTTLYTLMIWVANIVELKQFYISFNLFYDSASASVCS